MARKTDTGTYRPIDILIALALLSRWPVKLPDGSFSRSAAATWAFPIAGAIIAVPVTMVAFIALQLSPTIGAILAVAVAVITTGALHEDGLADCADGFWGGYTRERRLEIMKDSHIGTYGVVALGLTMALRVALIAGVIVVAPWALIAVAAMSRASLPLLMSALPNARGGGLSHQVGAPPRVTAYVALLLGFVVGFIAIGSAAGIVFGAGLIATILCAALAKQKIGGQTGDVLGATQQICEIAMLIALFVTI